MKSHQPFSTLWAAVCGFFEFWGWQLLSRLKVDFRPMFHYYAWTWKDDPRNEHGFEFVLKADDETEAFEFGSRLMAMYYPEHHINLPKVSVLDDDLSKHSHLTMLSTSMPEDEISSWMARDRKRRFYISPAARAR